MGMVRIWKNGELIWEKHNTMVGAGLADVITALGGGAISYVSQLKLDYGGSSPLTESATLTYTISAKAGTYNLTATCTFTNSTGSAITPSELHMTDNNGNDFATQSLSNITLNNGDSMKVSWEITM